METPTKKISPDVAELLAKGDALLAEAHNYLMQNGTKFPLDEWVTIAEYAKRFNLKSTNVVSNWIKRGIIPAGNILDVPELNDIRLIKAIPYLEK